MRAVFWSWPVGACVGAILAATSFYGLAVRPCQQAVEAADAVLATTGQALQASAAGHEASADDDVVGLLAATTTMSELTPTVTAQMQEYRETKSRC